MENKINVWTPDQARANLAERLKDAKADREKIEKSWRECEQALYNNSDNIEISYGSIDSDTEGEDIIPIGINYLFKNVRFLHAQLSANPPTVVPRPTSNDPEDRRKADAADRLIRYGQREYQFQEIVDRAGLYTISYGTGITKSLWDASGGDILSADETTGVIQTEGSYKITVPNIWNIYLDPEATCQEDIRYIFEKLYVPWEEACYRWPDKKETLKKYRVKSSGNSEGNLSGSIKYYDVVILFEYWEKGSPSNGQIGRYCICSEQGDLITEMQANPERYAPSRKSAKEKPKFPKAILPYQIFTDIDVPGQVWGKTVVEYALQLQRQAGNLDSAVLDMVRAHGVARIVSPESAEVSDENITNSPLDIITYAGNQPPNYMEPLPIPSIMPELMARYKMGIDDVMGVNESMFGQQSREQSGFSMQYATNQGNMIRRRLFNKYVLFVEQIYKAYLRIIIKKWDVPHTICVLGKEKAFEAVDIKGADIDGGFDLVVEYGTSLSLDPVSRREEMLTLMPLFEKAGVEPRKILEMIKLNELSGLYDTLDMAKDRQREIFETMISTGVYKNPEKLEDHKNMLQFCYYYRMSTEYKYLDRDSQSLIEQHILAREQMAAEGPAVINGTAAAENTALPAPAPAPAPAVPVTDLFK